MDSIHFLKTRLTRFRRLEVRLLKRSSPCSRCNTLEYKRSDKILSEGGGRGIPWIAARKGQTKPNQASPLSFLFVCYLSIRSPPLGGGARYQPPASSAIIAVPRIRCCFFSSLSPSPDSDTLDFSRSRDLFEESRESFDASAYDGREFPFGGRTIPVKNCSRNAEAVIPAIFLFRSLLFLAPTRPRESACMYNVYIFFQRVELYRAKTRLVIAKVIHPIPNLRERVILMNRMWNRSVERVGKYL